MLQSAHDFGPAPDDVVDALVTASRALVAVAARSLAATDEQVTLPQYRSLVVLAARGPQTVGQLAEQLQLHPSTTSRMCDRLVAKQLVDRAPGPESRREVVVSLVARRARDRPQGDRAPSARGRRDPGACAGVALAVVDRRPRCVLGRRRRATRAGVVNGVVVNPARWLDDRHRQELRTLAWRSNQVVLLAAVVGVATGALVAAFDWLVGDVMLEWTKDRGPWLAAVLPGIGLIGSFVARRAGGGGGVSSSTADEYLHSYHDRKHRLTVRPFVARMVAAVSTLGTGGAMGLEGPSIYTGATVGSQIQRRMPRVFRGADRRVLMVAGAAAGVAAIFKAPATGAVFAIEVPYQDDLARRMLLPSLVAAATGYLTFVAFHGTSQLFAIDSSAAFSFRDLLGALVIGVLAGLGARLFAWMVRRAKALAAPDRFLTVVASGAAFAALFAMGRGLTGESVISGPGYDVVAWASEPTALGAAAARGAGPALPGDDRVGRRGRGGRLVHPPRRRRRAHRLGDRRSRGRARPRAVHRRRCRCVPGRRLPSAAGGGDVRGRDDGSPRRTSCPACSPPSPPSWSWPVPRSRPTSGPRHRWSRPSNRASDRTSAPHESDGDMSAIADAWRACPLNIWGRGGRPVASVRGQVRLAGGGRAIPKRRHR